MRGHRLLPGRRASGPLRGGPVPVLWVVYVAVSTLGLITAQRPDLNRALLMGSLVTFQAAGVAFAVRASLHRRLPARTRRAWAGIAFSVVLSGAAGCLFAPASTSTGQAWQRANDLAATLLLASLLVQLIAILTLPGPRRTQREWLVLALDALMVTGSMSLGYWYFILGPTLQQGSAGTPITLAFVVPVADITVISAILFVLMRGVTDATRLPLGLLAAGLTCNLIPSLIAASRIAHGVLGSQATPLVFNLLLVAGGFLVVRASTLQVSEADREPAQRRLPRVRTSAALLPYVAVTAGYGLLLVAAARSEFYPWGGLVIGTIVMTGGVVVRQVIELRENQRLATTDPLTGLANRTNLSERLQQALERARRSHVPAAVLLFDLNGFKKINDTLGHRTGDATLVAFATVLRRNVLGSDVVSRIGGDEFAVVLGRISRPRDAVAVAERVLGELDQIATISGHEVSIGASVGITLTRGATDSPEAALHRADVAMYEAKRTGRSTWQVYLDQPAQGDDPRDELADSPDQEAGRANRG